MPRAGVGKERGRERERQGQGQRWREAEGTKRIKEGKEKREKERKREKREGQEEGRKGGKQARRKGTGRGESEEGSCLPALCLRSAASKTEDASGNQPAHGVTFQQPPSWVIPVPLALQFPQQRQVLRSSSLRNSGSAIYIHTK